MPAIATAPDSGNRNVSNSLPRFSTTRSAKTSLSTALPGTVNNYSTGETQVAAEIVRGAVGKPLATYLEEKIWRPYGMEAEAKWWLDSPNGREIGGSGLSATLRDYGRFGLFILGALASSMARLSRAPELVSNSSAINTRTAAGTPAISC